MGWGQATWKCRGDGNNAFSRKIEWFKLPKSDNPNTACCICYFVSVLTHITCLHKCWNCTVVWYSCQLVAKMSCSLCYDAGKSVAIRIANMMTARIVTLSKKSLPNHRLQHRLTADSIMWWCTQLNRNKRYDVKVINRQQFAHLCHTGSTVTDTKHHGSPDMSFISQMLRIYKRHVSECVLSTSSQQCVSAVTMISRQNNTKRK